MVVETRGKNRLKNCLAHFYTSQRKNLATSCTDYQHSYVLKAFSCVHPLSYRSSIQQTPITAQTANISCNQFWSMFGKKGLSDWLHTICIICLRAEKDCPDYEKVQESIVDEHTYDKIASHGSKVLIYFFADKGVFLCWVVAFTNMLTKYFSVCHSF